MQEKKFSLNNALLVWWFFAWRSFLVIVIVGFVLNYGLGLMFAEDPFIAELDDWLMVIVGIVAQVFFLRMAVNRDYSSKANGDFRLAAIESSQTQTMSQSQSTSQSDEFGNYSE